MRIGFQTLGLQFQEPRTCGWHECNRVPSELPAGSFNGHFTQELDPSATSVLAQILHRVQCEKMSGKTRASFTLLIHQSTMQLPVQSRRRRLATSRRRKSENRRCLGHAARESFWEAALRITANVRERIDAE